MPRMLRIVISVFSTFAILAGLGASPTAKPYDPMEISADQMPSPLDLVVKDAKRSRDIPVLIYLPRETAPQPVVLFSHGLGGSRKGSAFLGQHWSERGYVAVFVQHPGSDSSILKNAAGGQRLQSLKEAASLQNLLLRLDDIPAVLDQLEQWNKEPDNPLRGRLDMKHIGMSGHSFGAVTTQALSGENFRSASFTDPRISAAVIMSPSSARGGDAENQAAFGEVKIPWLLMTGTKDVAPIGDQDVASRLKVFSVLPAGRKYELVLDNAEHSVFTERALPGDKQQRNPKHHPAILAISTAFWDAYLRSDEAARAWLDGAGPRGILEEADQWSTK